MGGRSSTASTTQSSQVVDTTSVGLQDIEGVGVAGGRDVEFTQNITDGGAIQGAIGVAESSFDFAGEFGDDAFNFASDVARQAGQTAQQAVATSAAAIKTAGDATRSDTSQALVQIAKFAALAAGAFFVARAFAKG